MFRVEEMMVGNLVVLMILRVWVILFNGCVLMMRRLVVLVCVIVSGFLVLCIDLLVVIGMLILCLIWVSFVMFV